MLASGVRSRLKDKLAVAVDRMMMPGSYSRGQLPVYDTS